MQGVMAREDYSWRHQQLKDADAATDAPFATEPEETINKRFTSTLIKRHQTAAKQRETADRGSPQGYTPISFPHRTYIPHHTRIPPHRLFMSGSRRRISLFKYLLFVLGPLYGFYHNKSPRQAHVLC